MKTTLTVLVAFGLLIGAGPALSDNAHAPRTYQAVDMIALPSGIPDGAAWLIRSKKGLQGRVMTNVDTAGDPYTIWWVIFNNPEICIYTPCTVGENPLDDLLNPAVGVSIFSASGAISAHNGMADADGSVGVINVEISTVAGNHPDGLFVLDWIDGTAFGDRLDRRNGFGAEVHVVVDAHPEFASWVTELTTTNFGPNTNHRAAVFFPTRPIRRDDDSDSDSDSD